MAKAMHVREEIDVFSHPQIVSILIKNLGGKSILALTKLKVTKVSRTECAKASGKPGYVCAFSVAFANQGWDGKAWSDGHTANCEARFVKSPEGWTAAVDL